MFHRQAQRRAGQPAVGPPPPWGARPRLGFTSAADDPLEAAVRAVGQHHRPVPGDARRGLWPTGGPDQLVAPDVAGLEATASLRRLVCDLIEEYGRHTGHADLIREAVDGRVGEDPPPGWQPHP